MSILSTHVQTTQVNLVWLAVLELNEFAQASQELGVPVGAVLIGQNGELVAALQDKEESRRSEQSQRKRNPRPRYCKGSSV